MNEHVDPLTYPLLFPYGERGWCPELKVYSAEGSDMENLPKLQTGDFYAQRLMTFQTDEPQLPHAGGRAFQQYVVDGVYQDRWSAHELHSQQPG